MSSTSPQYKPLMTDTDDVDLDEISNPNRPYRDDDEGAPLSKPKFTSKPPSSRFCNGRRLSKSCIAVCVLVLAIFLSITGGSGYYLYKTEIINGQSPPWYPSPLGGTVSSWADSYAKAQKMVEKMTLMEKVNVTTGVGWAQGLCVGNTAEATGVGFPALCLQDGPLGLRFCDHATSFPAGITTGATWNRDLMRRRGSVHAGQAKMKGINVLLGPSMGPLGRHPAGGRGWEGFGADPVLQAVAASENIIGIQSQGVMATAKHFVGNEQEHFRKSFEWGLPEALSSNIDDRTMHEIYAWPFAESIRAGVASVMCSYQMVNNSYVCQNSKLMNGLLKDEMGFQGFVQSDWLAHRSGVASALAGLDQTMPGDGVHWIDGKSLFGEQLTIAALNGSIPMERVNDMATRVVAAWYQLGQDKWDSDGPNFSSWTDEETGKLHDGSSSSQQKVVVNRFVKAEDDESKKVARQVAAEGTVLLKNDDSVLPIDSKLSTIKGSDNPLKRVVIIGEDAGPGKGANYCDDRACNQGTLAVGWGSGATEFTYLVDPLSALNSTFDPAYVSVTASLSNKVNKNLRETLSEQHLCIVFANADGGEGHRAWNGVRADRNDLELQKNGNKLIKDVASSCGGPVVVVIHSIGPVILSDFSDLSSVKAILYANLPGQESGNALADVIFGEVDASGRLPYTIGKSLDDYGPTAPVKYYPNHIIPQADFTEGLYVDYRYFDKHDIKPAFPFGHGLSYTSFEYSDLKLTSLKDKSRLPSPRPSGMLPPSYESSIPDPKSALYPLGFGKMKKFIYPYISDTDQVKEGEYPYPDGYDIHREPSQAGGAEGGNPSLFEPHVQIDVNVKNIGSRPGKEVVQVYVSLPSLSAEIDHPVRVLRNFTKIELDAGESKLTTLTLSRKDLSYWSVIDQNWIMPIDGDYTIAVGRSSRDLPLKGTY